MDKMSNVVLQRFMTLRRADDRLRHDIETWATSPIGRLLLDAALEIKGVVLSHNINSADKYEGYVAGFTDALMFIFDFYSLFGSVTDLKNNSLEGDYGMEELLERVKNKKEVI